MIGLLSVLLAAPVQLTPREFVDLRCSADGGDVYFDWHGRIYADVPGERPRRLFDVVGMNVARCVQVDGAWQLLSRELSYYLDPETGAPAHRWTNPWTSEEVVVAHVANDPVQHQLGGPPAERVGARTVVALEIPLAYPNPLAGDPRFAPHDPSPGYSALEMFRFESRDGRVDLSWHRVGPWLPWMKMGGRPGRLVYSATGRKLGGYSDLPGLVRSEIETRLPVYRHAPRCWLQQRNQTSWTTFRRDFAHWLRGARFPLEAPTKSARCR